jgi:glycosyltransferase involved in cell wall biosynthesis
MTIDQHQPLVSVILPVRNGATTLAAAIDSIIHQTYSNWELLVFDDGSVDRTREVVHDAARSDARIKLFSDGQRKGLARRLNELVARSQGTLVARMDADDVSYPRRLELQVGFMGGHAAVDLLGTSIIVVSADGAALGKRSAPSEHDQITRHPGIGFPIYHPTWLGRAAWFRTHPYRAVARRCEDQDLLLRTYQRSRLANLTEPLLGYRAGGDLRATLRGRWSFVSR